MSSLHLGFRHKFRLRTTLVIPFVLQIVTAVGLVGYLSFRNSQKAVDDLANRLNREISVRIEQHVINYLNKSQNTLWLTYAGVKSGNFNLQDYDRLRRYFWQLVNTGTFEGYAIYGNEQGEFVGVEYQENGTVELKIRTLATAPIRHTYLLDDRGEPQKLLKSAKYDPRTRPWYKAAVQAGKPTWSEIYPFFSSNNTVLGLSPVYPVYDAQNKLLGVLCINIRLAQITDFIQQLQISPNGQSFIIERSGDLVASSTMPQPFKIVGTGDDRKIERIAATRTDNPVVKQTAHHLLERFGQFSAIQSSATMKFQMPDGAWYYSQVLPIRDGRGIDWLTVVVVPERDFMAQITANTRNTIALCGVALVVAIAIGILTARWIAEPIDAIAAASQAMAAGKLNQHVHSAPIQELNHLADAFNSMANQLNESFATLEDRVVERTTELATANAEIGLLNEKLKEDNLRMGAELNVARQIQQMILPKPEELEIAGLDIVGFMEPADEVGGDYYDVLYTDGVVTISMGDVTGHGLESGILMLMTQTAVRTLKEVREQDPVRFLDTLNRTIYKNVQRMDSEKNLTLVVLNYAHGRVSISGQHEETIVVRRDGQIERIDTIDLGFPIGLDDDIAQFISHAVVELQPGDGLVLYTDGITEAQNDRKQLYGVERLCTVISQHWERSANEVKQAVIEDVRRHIGKAKVFDDITLLVLKQQTLVGDAMIAVSRAEYELQSV